MTMHEYIEYLSSDIETCERIDNPMYNEIALELGCVLKILENEFSDYDLFLEENRNFGNYFESQGFTQEQIDEIASTGILGGTLWDN